MCSITPVFRRAALVLAVVTTLAACAGGPFDRGERDDAATATVPVSVTVTPDADVTRPERRPDAGEGADTGNAVASDGSSTARGADGLLGETLAGLGSPSERGLWLRTGLVQSTQQGRVETDGGASLTLELRPSGREPGSGSHLSLEAMQQLGLPLTQLATLRVLSAR